ncbi:Cyclic peptide transporter [Purpureocillium lavendulum]|uniref:Cyclic peptide transporter n=1 Tax=Purpureocillium lavendulum TaxID=1247861 RepID=A0AB34FVM0_9HYPO|nr:Cyclic peptide transporter [Purpureocillium lavendulum]
MGRNDPWQAGHSVAGRGHGHSLVASPNFITLLKDHNGISLRASEHFCKIAARIQRRMAQAPLLALPEILELDSTLLNWKSSLHPLFRDEGHCPETLRSARALLRCRLLTLRLTLYRPHLINAALNGSTNSACSIMSNDERDLIARCRAVAVDTVETIAGDWFPNQICAWHSAWHLFQAALVLLLGQITEPENTDAPAWDQSLHKTVDLFDQMKRWCPGAGRSGEVVRFLYGAKSKPASEGNSASTMPDNEFMDLLNMDILNGEADWIDFDSMSSPADWRDKI